ncbi:MAG: OsmC family protein [Saprospiraceae bacterium]|nr:OsmC family protein [Saprospiraceae bacterium]MCC7507448.1 OsmC family protein [Saprospiraceae bacterium]
MTSKVEYLGDLRTRATHLQSGIEIITDAPLDNQGRGEAFSPTDLCATSLASCMMTIMGISARSRELDITGARAEVTKIMAANPRRIARVEIRLIMPKRDFSERDRQLLETAGRTCPVALSLGDGVEQVVEFEW